MKTRLALADTMLVIPTNSRRMLTAMANLCDVELGVVPRLRLEFETKLGQEFQRREVQRLHGRPVRKVHRVLAADDRFADIAKSWVTEALDDENVPFARLNLDIRDRERAIRLSFDGKFRRAFKDRIAGDISTDGQIIAEGVVKNVDSIVSDNMKTIYHAKLNEWMRTEMGFNEKDFLMQPDEWAKSILWDRNPAELVAAVFATTLPEDDNALDLDRNTESARRFLFNASFVHEYAADLAGAPL